MRRPGAPKSPPFPFVTLGILLLLLAREVRYLGREGTSARRRRNAIGSSLSNLGTRMLSEADLWHV